MFQCFVCPLPLPCPSRFTNRMGGRIHIRGSSLLHQVSWTCVAREEERERGERAKETSRCREGDREAVWAASQAVRGCLDWSAGTEISLGSHQRPPLCLSALQEELTNISVSLPCNTHTHTHTGSHTHTHTHTHRFTHMQSNQCEWIGSFAAVEALLHQLVLSHFTCLSLSPHTHTHTHTHKHAHIEGFSQEQVCCLNASLTSQCDSEAALLRWTGFTCCYAACVNVCVCVCNRSRVVSRFLCTLANMYVLWTCWTTKWPCRFSHTHSWH